MTPGSSGPRVPGPRGPGAQGPKGPGSEVLRTAGRRRTWGQGQKTTQKIKKQRKQEASISKKNFGRISWVVCPSCKGERRKVDNMSPAATSRNFCSENHVPSGNLLDGVADRKRRNTKKAEIRSRKAIISNIGKRCFDVWWWGLFYPFHDSGSLSP